MTAQIKECTPCDFSASPCEFNDEVLNCGFGLMNAKTACWDNDFTGVNI